MTAKEHRGAGTATRRTLTISRSSHFRSTTAQCAGDAGRRRGQAQHHRILRAHLHEPRAAQWKGHPRTHLQDPTERLQGRDWGRATSWGHSRTGTRSLQVRPQLAAWSRRGPRAAVRDGQAAASSRRCDQEPTRGPQPCDQQSPLASCIMPHRRREVDHRRHPVSYHGKAATCVEAWHPHCPASRQCQVDTWLEARFRLTARRPPHTGLLRCPWPPPELHTSSSQAPACRMAPRARPSHTGPLRSRRPTPAFLPAPSSQAGCLQHRATFRGKAATCLEATPAASWGPASPAGRRMPGRRRLWQPPCGSTQAARGRTAPRAPRPPAGRRHTGCQRRQAALRREQARRHHSGLGTQGLRPPSVSCLRPLAMWPEVHRHRRAPGPDGLRPPSASRPRLQAPRSEAGRHCRGQVPEGLQLPHVSSL